MDIDVSTVEIEERGVKVRLTVVDTPGYGDAIDNTDWLVKNYYSNMFFIKYFTCLVIQLIFSFIKFIIIIIL